MYGNLDHETGEATGLTATSSFGEENIRKGFIRKVYGILTVQLALTMVSEPFLLVFPLDNKYRSFKYIRPQYFIDYCPTSDLI